MRWPVVVTFCFRSLVRLRVISCFVCGDFRQVGRTSRCRWVGHASRRLGTPPPASKSDRLARSRALSGRFSELLGPVRFSLLPASWHHY
ncbi:hypothetical protein BJY52DRAFT_1301317 [Lactarius psammicola]|nr:hypothetical protein BJY52DRAFT_1301317 [Lactarius psammicola]